MAACKVGKLIGNTHRLSAKDRALVRQWLDNGTDARGRRVSAVVIAQALTLEGHPVSATAMKDHRGARCGCYREDRA